MTLFFLLATSLVICLLAYLTLTTARQYLRLRHFDGPFWAQFTDLYFVAICRTGRQHLTLGEIGDKYGHMCRIGPNMLLCDDEEFLRKMNAVRTNYTKSGWYAALKLDGHYDNVLSLLDNNEHMALRNKLLNGYWGTGNPKFEADIDAVVLDVINLIDSKYISQGDDLRPFDHAQIMQYLTLDV